MINIFPKICKLFPGITGAIVHFGMTVVATYHLYIESPFFNTAFEEAKGIEKLANVFFIPSHYLCDGKVISIEEGKYQIKNRFHYEKRKKLYAPLALTFYTPGTLLGTVCKQIALFFPEVQRRHHNLKRFLKSPEVVSNHPYYQEIGLDTSCWEEGKQLTSQGYLRRPGDETNLSAEKKALSAISKLLSEANIPFWVDCGTLIGAYRYGGVIPWDYDLDLSILETDFHNAYNVLKQLDSKEFVVQDWSSRVYPGTYLRVYVKENRSHIDLYCHSIDEKHHTVQYIISHEESHFMADGWKERERRQAAPIPFDIVFPLGRGMLDGIDVPVPKNTEAFLNYKYGPNLNPVRLYSMETGEYEKDLTHPYWEIPLTN